MLEALGSTKLNLLYDVGFNREVAEDGALYWTLEDGNLAKLIDRSDSISKTELEEMGEKAKQRIQQEYRWEYICQKYGKVFKGYREYGSNHDGNL